MDDRQGASLMRLALELIAVECTCEFRSPSGMVSFRPATRKTLFYRTPGPSVTCVRCRVRRALEDDGVVAPEIPLDRGGF